ncbi:hypothetical protein ACHAXA_006069 [Cyclostephanos tholiformis]|uniref:Uncharacterized protein n=1 Tax=Cyclostephanos tholiformis TaxID=382380 RepID=A0ABD3SAT4_9STRA
MEEPPKIDRIISSHGLSLADTASLLKSFLLNIDRYHGHRHRDDGGRDYDISSSYGKFRPDDDRSTATVRANDADGGGGGRNNDGGARGRSWQEREEEALIAQMDTLAADNSATGVSDDVLERLGMITRSICAEVEGRPLSASGVMMTVASGRDDGADDAIREIRNVEDQSNDIGDDDSLPLGSNETGDSARREERRKRRQQQQQQQQQPQPREENLADKTTKDRKKEKKAKKAAKKAKKDAKRKAKELENVHEKVDSKRMKVET